MDDVQLARGMYFSVVAWAGVNEPFLPYSRRALYLQLVFPEKDECF